MELYNKIMPVLWKILDSTKDGAINIATIDKKLTINILLGKRKKTFTHEDEKIVLRYLEDFLITKCT
jgi:hypothetical protein